MSRNSSGTYTLPSGNPVVSGTLIEASWANTTLSDLASAMTDSLSRSGQGGMTAALRLYDGTSSVPGLAWGSETTTGWYRAGSGDMRLVVTGSEVMKYLATGVSITGTLSASGNTTVGGTLGVTGAATLTGALTANGGVSTTTMAASGNATVGGTLAVTGASTFTGAITANGGVVGAVTGNASTATALQTARTIWGQSFNGTANVTGALTGVTDLTASGNGSFGGTLSVTGAATLTANPTLSAGTANGVAYLNGSKVLTTGSALQFDGTNLGLGVTPSAWISSVKALDISSAASFFSESSITANVGSNIYVNSGGTNTYKTNNWATMYRQFIGQHQWFTAPSGTAGNAISFTQAMTLDASGNLALGTTTPVSVSNYELLTINGTTGGGWYLQSGGTSVGAASVNSGGMSIGTVNSTPMIFITNSTDRGRFDSSGNFLVGTSSAAGKITIAQTASSAVGLGVDIQAISTKFANFSYQGTGVGSISYNGTLTVYSTTSDYRLKTVIGAVSDQGARIDALEPIEYEWKSNGQRTRGFLAHKFQEVYPSSVTGEKDAVDDEGNPMYQQMQPSTPEAMADIFAELKSLRARLAAAGIA